MFIPVSIKTETYNLMLKQHEYPGDLKIPHYDKEQFKKITNIINLKENKEKLL